MAEVSVKDYQQLITNQVNNTMQKAGFYAMLLAFLCAAILFTIVATGTMKNMHIPAWWALVCGFFSALVYLFARGRLIKGWLQYALYLPFASLPTVVLVLTELFLPAGAATYLNGPPMLLYFFLVIISGFLFNRILSVFSALLVSVQYFAFAWLAHDHLAQITAPDELMQQDLVSLEIYGFKALMLAAAGPVVGILSETSKKLMTRMLLEQEEKRSIDQLFGQFVSSEVKDKLVAASKEMVGERKLVTVLFSDLRSFSTYSEGREPEVIVAQLNEYFDKMVDCIMKEGGTVDKFIGDAIMAVFGGLLDLENSCEAALRAAHAMHRELALLNAGWQKKGLPTFSHGIGLHYGEVLEGTIGSKSRKQFTVIGDTVNTAARLEATTKQFKTGIVLSDSVFKKLGAALQDQCRGLGETEVKGRAQVISIYAGDAA